MTLGLAPPEEPPSEYRRSRSPESSERRIFLHSSASRSKLTKDKVLFLRIAGRYSRAPIPDEPTIASLVIGSISSGRSPIFRSILSTSSLPHPSGRESANTPNNPSKGSGLEILTPCASGRENGFREYPLLIQSSEYSNAVRYL